MQLSIALTCIFGVKFQISNFLDIALSSPFTKSKRSQSLRVFSRVHLHLPLVLDFSVLRLLFPLPLNSHSTIIFLSDFSLSLVDIDQSVCADARMPFALHCLAPWTKVGDSLLDSSDDDDEKTVQV